MRKLLFSCDNCKREYESIGIRESNTLMLKVSDIGQEDEYMGYDICMECRRMFLKIFQLPAPRIPGAINESLLNYGT